MLGRPEGKLFGALADTLASDWRRVARPSQRMPAGEWIIWLILAGRGFGKCRTGAETVRLQKLAAQDERTVELVSI